MTPNLEHYGWNAKLTSHFEQLGRPDLVPARVIRAHRSLFAIVTETGECDARLAGRFHLADDSERPAVGDWVTAQCAAGSVAVIRHVLPRRSQFVRKAAGEKTREQVVAANVDVVFLMNGLDGDFNLRRIERYVTLAWESGATPVVILNKRDLCNDVSSRLREVERIAPGVSVIAISAWLGEGVADLQEHMGVGKTIALIGSSGTGKSTLVNCLLQEDRMKVQDVRVDDSRGRHTTTHRELIVLPDGTLLIDTPGMRELQVWGGNEALEASFADVEEIAARCRFANCRHQSEPGCAVRAALRTGELDENRYGNYQKLQAEYAYLERRQDQYQARQHHQAIVRIHRQMRKEQRK